MPPLLVLCTAASAAEPFTYVPSSSPVAAFSVMVRVPGRRCSGVLISSDTVLTAAHCVGPETIDARRVHVSFPLLSGGAVPWTCGVTSFAYHPLWSDPRISGRQAAFDVGLLHFACPLPPRAGPIAIDYAKAHSATGTSGLPVEVVGFGNLVDERVTAGDRPAVELSDPRLKLRPVDMRVPDIFDTPAMITLQGSAGFICHGDSGGAVYSQTLGTGHALLLGVNSQTGYGQGCTTTSFVARLDSSYDWIRRTMADMGSRPPLPPRPDDADACAEVAVSRDDRTDTPHVEVTATNVCAAPIRCSLIGWTSLSTGKMSSFKSDVSIEAGGTHALKIFTHRTSPAYATAVCDRD